MGLAGKGRNRECKLYPFGGNEGHDNQGGNVRVGSSRMKRSLARKEVEKPTLIERLLRAKCNVR